MRKALAPLSWHIVLTLDLSLALTIIGVATAIFLGQLPLILQKAHMSEALVNMALLRGDSVEQIALAGDLAGFSSSTQVPIANTSGDYQYQRTGTAIVAAGATRGTNEQFRLGFNPALNGADLGWSVLWLCGMRRPPPGWREAAPPVAMHLTNEQLPFACRKEQTE